MLPATTINILLLATSIVSIIIAGIIFAADRKSRQNLLVSLALLSASLWGLAIFWTIITSSLSLGNFAFFFSAAIPPILIIFILSFRNLLTPKKTAAILIPSAVMALLTLIPNSVSKGIDTTKGYIELITPGPLLVPFYIYFFAYVIALFYLLAKAEEESEGIKKVQLKYIIFGLGSSVFFGALFNLLLPLLGVYQFNNLGPVFILFMSSAMAYAATKHYLRESQIIFSEIWAFLLVFIVLVWFLLHSSIFNALLFVLVLGVCIMFIRSVLSEARKNFELEKQKRELERDKEELKTLDKLKDDFLKMATHELNTPATVIQGKMSMIFDESLGNFGGEQKEFLQPVFNNSKRLIVLIKEILDAVKIDQGEAELSLIDTDLVEVITKIVAKKQIEAGPKSIEIIFNQPKEKVPLLKIDPLKVQDVIINLLDNAIKFSKTGGKIIIEMLFSNNEMIISVSDDGVGISSEDQKSIFSKFFQAKRFDAEDPQEQQGSGLGLYISKKFVELHKGRMWFESKSGIGSKFSFSLPVKQL